MTPYNFRRLIGYTVLALLLALLLSGCGLLPSRFDSQEHAMIVNVHVISQDDGVCNSRDKCLPSRPDHVPGCSLGLELWT